MTAAAVPAEKPAAPTAPPITPIVPVDPLAYTEPAPEFSEKTRAILATPVDPELVETRRAGKGDNDRELQYVPWIHYQDILFRAFGAGGWRLVPRGVARTEGNEVTWSGALFVREPGTSKFQFVKEAKGACNASIGANAAEGAQSDCLVKCCKALHIFMELFDPRWRRAWESKYRQQHGRQMNAAQWPAARSGAAALEPAPAARASGASPSSEPSGGDGSSAAPAADLESSPSSPETAIPDTGEAATDEQKDALRGAIRKLEWKLGYVRMWFAGLFGPLFSQGDPLEKLTQRQADCAYYLVLAHGKPLYDKLLADEREKGNVL